jgi:hypothetical protein
MQTGRPRPPRFAVQKKGLLLGAGTLRAWPSQPVQLDVWALVVRLCAGPLGAGAVAKQMSLNLGLLAGSLHAGPFRSGPVAKQMRLYVL